VPGLHPSDGLKRCLALRAARVELAKIYEDRMGFDAIINGSQAGGIPKARVKPGMVNLGLSRTVALYDRPSTLYQIH
jgi:hypothetical protein